MKKILALMLVLAAVFSLCACGETAPAAAAPATTAAVTAASEEGAASVADAALEEAEEAAAEAIDEAVTETIEELPALPEYEVAVEKLKTLVEGDLTDFVIDEDYVITIPSKWWALDKDILAEFNLEYTFAAITTLTIPGFTGYTTDDIIDDPDLRDALLGGIMGELQDVESEDYRDFVINGIRVLAQKASYTVSDDRFTSDFHLFLDEKGNLVSITTLQSESAKSDYTERFETIINTLRHKEEEKKEPENMMDIKDVPVIYIGRISGASANSNVRIAQVSGEFKFEYVRPYHKEYFRSDEERHFLICSDYTACIVDFGDDLYIALYKHVPGEELDESIIPAGDMVAEFIMDIQTGKISG